MELITTIDNDDSFRLDAPLEFLNKFRSFELLFAQMGFGLITTMIKTAKQRDVDVPYMADVDVFMLMM